MNPFAFIWSDPRFVYAIAIVAVALLFITVWLFRRPKRTGRQAGLVCLMLSILAHLALLLLVPMLSKPNGGSTTVDREVTDNVGIDSVTFSTFDEAIVPADAAGEDESATVAPLPVSQFQDLLTEPALTELLPPTVRVRADPIETSPAPVPESLAESSPTTDPDWISELDDAISDSLDTQLSTPDAPAALAQETLTPPRNAPMTLPDLGSRVGGLDPTVEATPVAMSTAPPAIVAGTNLDDFANRNGSAKNLALNRTGGNEDTEAAVASALSYLASKQGADGAWDPISTGGGIERAPLGENRGAAGRNAKTAVTGLAMLAFMGAGNTHQKGEYSENVYQGLAYLIRTQQPDGSLAGNASIYASTYCHGMASLAMCEAAAITHDESAITAAKRAIAFTTRMQHPTTGGWRYTPGDPGDMSQLGWQAMVLDAGHRAGITIDRRAITGVQRFIRSCRAGRNGGLASYRPGEAISRTMTAEALATRLLVGDRVPEEEVAEAERYVLQRLPGDGQDNYYYWYYATLALHQAQDEAWTTWNEALQRQLLTTQRFNGSWPTNSVWGGYGGSVYTTAMATLCLESYYRHTLRSDRERVADSRAGSTERDNPLR